MILLSKHNLKVVKTNLWRSRHAMKIMHLSPSTSSGFGNTCGRETIGCKDSCFRNSGFFLLKHVQSAHDFKTEWFFKEPSSFGPVLLGECISHQYESLRDGRKPVIRLNGTSDIAWEEDLPEVFERCPDTQFFDYTKHFSRMLRFVGGIAAGSSSSTGRGFPANYHLTFSRSENNWIDCEDVLDIGGNVAVVFEEKPETYGGYPVIDGDKHDLRFLDDSPRIVGLTPKGKARIDMTGFRVRRDMLPKGYTPLSITK